MKALILITSLLLVGCGSVKPQLTHIKTVYKNTPIICPNPPEIEKITLGNLKWIQAKDEEGMPVIGLYPDDYEILGKNTAKLLLRIKQGEAVKWYYLECINNHNEKQDQ